MNFKKVLIVIFIYCISGFNNIYSQEYSVKPINGSTLNYRQIMFEVPKYPNAKIYNFNFFECDKRGENCRAIYSYKSKFRYALLTDPFEFNRTYRWNYEIKSGSKVVFKSEDFVFYTGWSELLDTNIQKMVFTRMPKKHRPGLLLVDGLKMAVDMQGKPILYLNYKVDHAVRDINLTNNNTFTLVDNRLGEVKEMELNGEMIWIGPTKHEESEGRSDKFHHEFEKLQSGNYLAAGKRLVSDFDHTAGLEGVPDNLICETMVEFDSDRNEVWRFDLLPELKRQLKIAPTAEVFNPSRLGHLNGMAVDEKKNIVYASFKTFNTVMKIDKQNNTILYRYGLKNINFKDSVESGLLFEQQHAPIFNSRGNLIIFNNGNPETGSGITELLVADSLTERNEVVGRIYFKDYLDKDIYSVQMGSVQETDKNQYLVCMGSLNHFFELKTRGKRILWQAYTYQNTRWNEKAYAWKPLHSYRIHKYSSLYPYHYLADVARKDKRVELKIVNSGTEPDEYVIFIKVGDNKPKFILTTLKLKPQKATKVRFKNLDKNAIIFIESKSGIREF